MIPEPTPERVFFVVAIVSILACLNWWRLRNTRRWFVTRAEWPLPRGWATAFTYRGATTYVDTGLSTEEAAIELVEYQKSIERRRR